MQQNGYEEINFLLPQGNLENTHAALPSSVRFHFMLDAVNGILEDTRNQYNTPEDEIEPRLTSVSIKATGWQKELREYLISLLD